jgi:hypothetical protein
MAYDKPTFNNIPFTFTTSGYQKPVASGVLFKFGGKPVYQQTANLQAAINVMGIYQTSTYTYLKECPTYVTGYTGQGIQVLNLPCVYGGIRDIGAYIIGLYNSLDLNAIINIWGTGTKDLGGVLKGVSVGNIYDIAGYINPFERSQFGLLAYINQTYTNYMNLKGVIEGWAREVPRNLPAAIKPWIRDNYRNLGGYLKQSFTDTYELQSYLKQTYLSYIDLISIIRGWYRETERNLPAAIRSWHRNNYRDLGGYITQVHSSDSDLQAYLNQTYIDHFDIGSLIKGWYIEDTKNLGAAIKPWYINNTFDLNAFLKQGYQGEKDITAYLKQTYTNYINLGALLKGVFVESTKNLTGYIKRIDQIEKDLAAYTRTNIREYIDLGAQMFAIPPFNLSGDIFAIPPFDLPATLIVYDRIVHLLAIIYAQQYRDLVGVIKAGFKSTYDLGASIGLIYIKDLPSYISGFKGVQISTGLSALLIAGYGPYDLQAYINGTGGYSNLYAALKIMTQLEVPTNLYAFISGWYTKNLSAYISTINPVNLTAFIVAVGKFADLSAFIVPRVVYVKQSLMVSLLEHRNLSAMINFSCFASDYKNLNAYLYAINKLDLGAVIFGWHVNVSESIKNLNMCINVGVISVEDVLPLKVIPTLPKYTLLKLKFDITPTYRVFNTLGVLFGSYYASDLSATLTGVLESLNLSARVNAVFDWNYSELPPYVNPKTHEVVIDFDARGRENWRRFVELFFDHSGESPYHYFYVNGTNKVYRIDRDRHWIIRATSYVKSSGTIRRRNVRRKYIFKMSNYSNVDEAVRDLIDRVSSYRRVSLLASITGVMPPHLNLSASIIPDVKYSWIKYLEASIVGQLRGYIGTESLNLPAFINGV